MNSAFMAAQLDLTAYLNSHRELIEKKLDDLLKKRPQALHHQLFEASRYSLLSGGKRLRPLLCLATAETFDAPFEKALLPACALEMIHTYSLIHDDLPCMDDDDLRRGAPTLHKVYNEGHAVLTGDFLLTYAFEILSESPFLCSSQTLALIQTLARRAGADGMIGGQVVDLASEGKQIDWETLKFLHLHKTASLLMAALEFGAIIADVSDADRATLANAGAFLGLAYQIVDDILDETSTQQHLGKPIGSDLENKKATAISLLGLELAREEADKLYASSLDAFQSLSRKAPLLETITCLLIQRDR